MNILNLRAEQTSSAGARAVATAFVQALAAGNFVLAARSFEGPVTWFGETIEAGAWCERAAVALGDASMEARFAAEVLAGVLSDVPRDVAVRTLDGALRSGHALNVFDFRRDDLWVSLGVLTRSTESGECVVERVLDLRRLKEHVVASAA